MTKLEDYYSYLDKNSQLIFKSYKLHESLNELRKYAKETQNDTALQKIQFEYAFLRIEFSKDIPIVSLFDKETLKNEFNDYVLTRLDSSNSSIIKARLFQVLWAITKNNLQGQKAIDNYIDGYLYLNEDVELHEYISDILETSFEVSLNIKYRIDEVAKFIFEQLVDDNYSQELNDAMRLSLSEVVIDNFKIFKSFPLEKVSTALLKCAKILSESMNDSLLFEYYIERGIRYAEKLKIHKSEWYSIAASYYENIAKREINGAGIFEVISCQKAIGFYRKIKNLDKVHELEVHYSDIKYNLKLDYVKSELDLTELHKLNNEIIASILGNGSQFLFIHLANSTRFLPNLSQLRESTKNDFLNHALNVLIDDANNIIQSNYDYEDSRKSQLLLNYKAELSFNTIFFLKMLIDEAIKKDILNYKAFMKYLSETWFANTLSFGDNDYEKNWLKEVSSAMQLYLHKRKLAIEDNIELQYDLEVDSLIMKIEGIVRTLFQIRGIPTSKHKQSNENEIITEEKNIIDLLNSDEINAFFSYDDIFFFKFILIEKGGYNLRNKIAHSLTNKDSYNTSLMDLTFLLILRFTKFQIKVNAKNTELH